MNWILYDCPSCVLRMMAPSLSHFESWMLPQKKIDLSFVSWWINFDRAQKFFFIVLHYLLNISCIAQKKSQDVVNVTIRSIFLKVLRMAKLNNLDFFFSLDVMNCSNVVIVIEAFLFAAYYFSLPIDFLLWCVHCSTHRLWPQKEHGYLSE